MNQIFVLKEELQKLKYKNEEGENLLEDKQFNESDIRRKDKELGIPFEMDFIEEGKLYELNYISRLYYYSEYKKFDFIKRQDDEEYIDFDKESDLLKIDIMQTVSFEVMLKMKKSIIISINSKISFVVFLNNCTLLISVEEMYSKNNIKILKILRSYFEYFPMKSDNENLEKEIFISNNEIYYVNDTKEYGGKSDIPSSSNFYIWYDQGQFVASTNIKDSCYLRFSNTSTKFPIYVEDEIHLCKFNESDFSHKILKFSDRNSKRIKKNTSFFVQDPQQLNELNQDLRRTVPNNLQRPGSISNSLNTNMQESQFQTNIIQNPYMTNSNLYNQNINHHDRKMGENFPRTQINPNNFGNPNNINSNRQNNNIYHNINVNQVNDQNMKKLEQYNINHINHDKTEKNINLVNINIQQNEPKNDKVLLKENQEDNLKIQNVYNVDDFGSFKKLLEIERQEKEKMRTYCRYCNYSKRADFFLHPECRNHNLENNLCAKCHHIICKDCSILYKRCFFDNESVNKLERI